MGSKESYKLFGGFDAEDLAMLPWTAGGGNAAPDFAILAPSKSSAGGSEGCPDLAILLSSNVGGGKAAPDLDILPVPTKVGGLGAADLVMPPISGDKPGIEEFGIESTTTGGPRPKVGMVCAAEFKQEESPGAYGCTRM